MAKGKKTKGNPFFDLRRRMQSFDIKDAKDKDAINYLLGHEKTRIERMYDLKDIKSHIQLQKELQSKYKIRNKGVSTKTRFRKGERPVSEIDITTSRERKAW